MADKKHFWHRLESLRGIFALTVAVHHCLSSIIRGPHWLDYLYPFFYGHGAVLSFFILSGLVLGNSLRRSGDKTFWPFYVRRVLRIYPAFAAAIAFSLLLLAAFHFEKTDSRAATPYYEAMFKPPLSVGLVVNNMFLHEFTLDNVTWTIYIELIGSLFLPVMAVLSRKSVSGSGLMVLLLIVQVVAQSSYPEFSGRYLWVFYLGYLIPLWTGKHWQILAAHRALLALQLLVSLTVCLLTPHFAHHEIPYGLAMGFIISAVYHLPEERLFSFLDNFVVRFYGRISYSFYLLHFLVLYFLGGLIFKNFKAEFIISHAFAFITLLAVVSIAVNTPLSWACYTWVEKPFVRLGQKWSDAVKAD